MKSFIPSNIQTDHFTSHAALLPVYEKLFAPIKDTTNSILEIGTNDGGGIKMYSDYFKNSQAVAMDILPMPPGLGHGHIRYFQRQIRYFQLDAYDMDSFSLIRGFAPFALIVDDGSHTLKDQIWFCKNYPAMLAMDGIAIVEDIQDEKYVKLLAGAVPSGFNSMAIDQRHVNGRFDDLILVIWPKP